MVSNIGRQRAIIKDGVLSLESQVRLRACKLFPTSQVNNVPVYQWSCVCLVFFLARVTCDLKESFSIAVLTSSAQPFPLS